MSQEQLGGLSNLDRTYISLLERGLRQPTIETVFKISRPLKTNPSEIIRQVENQILTDDSPK
jgi:transcriptional regulator with XRE-family HTH domain